MKTLPFSSQFSQSPFFRGCCSLIGVLSKEDSGGHLLKMGSCILKDQLGPRNWGWAHFCQERYRDVSCGMLAHGPQVW